MARPAWTGTLSFGMVSIPVRLMPAVRRKSVSFNQLEAETMARIRYRKVSDATGEEVPSERIVKGYEVGNGEYVTITDEDLAPLAPRKSKQLELEAFVPADDIDPMMFDSSYYVVPDKTAKPYALLAGAMSGSGRVGIGRFVMRQKEYLAVVRSDGDVLTLSTLVFPDELVDATTVEGFDELDDVEVSDKELLMARSLVEVMSEDFDPDRVAVEQLIEQKAAGIQPAAVEEAPRQAVVIDLAAALEASLREATAAKAAGSAPAPAPAPSKAAKRKAPAKKATPRSKPAVIDEDEKPARARAKKSA
jgi:DNA end-binding protein Ku